MVNNLYSEQNIDSIEQNVQLAQYANRGETRSDDSRQRPESSRLVGSREDYGRGFRAINKTAKPLYYIYLSLKNNIYIKGKRNPNFLMEMCIYIGINKMVSVFETEKKNILPIGGALILILKPGSREHSLRSYVNSTYDGGRRVFAHSNSVSGIPGGDF